MIPHTSWCPYFHQVYRRKWGTESLCDQPDIVISLKKKGGEVLNTTQLSLLLGYYHFTGLIESNPVTED